MRHARSSAYALAVVVFYASFFLLMASGHLSSVDAGAQLQSAIRVVTAGDFGADALPPTGASGWQRAPNGRFYEPHDIGNTLLMLPAAWVGRLVSPASADADFADPPIASRVAVSLTCALVNAVTCTMLFALFALWWPRRESFLLSLLFATTTIVLPYAKTSWDVVAASAGVSATGYFAGRLLADRGRVATAAGLGAAVGATLLFRYSLAPFLFASVALVLVGSLRTIGWRGVTACAATIAGCLLPSFAFNQLRTGQFWRPGTATPAYLETNNALGGSIVHGAIGLLAAPNRGLLVFSPIFLLLFALPFVWSKLGRPERRTIAAMGVAAATFWLFTAQLKNWGGAFSWGPRYLLPILPLLFPGVAAALRTLWPRWRLPLAALIATSFLLCAAPAVVNASLAIAAVPAALDQDAPLPRQHAVVWRALLNGLEGKPMPVPAAVANDPVRLAGTRFPDFWTARLMERSRTAFVAGLVITVALAFVSLVALWWLTRSVQI